MTQDTRLVPTKHFSLTGCCENFQLRSGFPKFGGKGSENNFDHRVSSTVYSPKIESKSRNLELFSFFLSSPQMNFYEEKEGGKIFRKN